MDDTFCAEEEILFLTLFIAYGSMMNTDVDAERKPSSLTIDVEGLVEELKTKVTRFMKNQGEEDSEEEEGEDFITMEFGDHSSPLINQAGGENLAESPDHSSPLINQAGGENLAESPDHSSPLINQAGGENLAESSDHSSSLVIQAGGVAPYHPLHNPCAPRPTFLRYGKKSPEFSTVDIERSEEESKGKGKAESEAETDTEADQGSNGDKSQVIEQFVNESHGPQLAQDPHNFEDQRSQITTQESKQAQEPNDTTEFNPNSLFLLAQRINTSTVGFKRSRPIIRKMMLPVFMLLVLVSVTSGFDMLVLDNNILGASIVHHHSAHMNPLPLTERVSLSQKMEGFFFLLWESPLHSECMGRIKNSTSTFVGKLVDSYYFCSCSSFSYLTSWTTEENWAEFSRRLIGTFLSFCQDILVSMRSAAEEIWGLCKSWPGKTATEDQASKDESNQIIHVNSSTVPVYRSQQPTIDQLFHPEAYDQIEIVTKGEDNSTFCEKNAALGSQRVHFNFEPVFPVRQDTLNTTFNTTSDLTYKLGLDYKSTSKDETNNMVQGNSSFVPVYPSKEPTSFNINVKRYVHPQPYDQIVAEDEENSTFLAIVMALAIMLILVAGRNRWRKTQEIEVTKQYDRNKPRQRRQQTEQTVTPTLGSYVDAATAVRRSV
ncbi:hypothetical protein SUGI_0393620 [Cryptomeria japonica]|nr:hypothetical protein SUGI_0393620 [Cryptomeria japonica]